MGRSCPAMYDGNCRWFCVVYLRVLGGFMGLLGFPGVVLRVVVVSGPVMWVEVVLEICHRTFWWV